MIELFILYALLGGIGVALIAAPLGCFVIWQRMSYLGDALAHASLLGIILGLMLDINLTLAVTGIALLFSYLLSLLQERSFLSVDSILGILAYGALSCGLILSVMIDLVRVDLMGYLFGDILTVRKADLILIYAGGSGILLWLYHRWQLLLLTTIHKDLAKSQGIKVDLIQRQFQLLLALMIALSIKIVGILLIMALLIIPAATARSWCKNPESMVACAMLAGMLAVILGLTASLRWDLPSGPAIVLAAVLGFIVSLLRFPRYDRVKMKN